jgi:hypothetical protein
LGFIQTINEPGAIEFLYEGQIDELLRARTSSRWFFDTHFPEHDLNSFDCRIRLFWNQRIKDRVVGFI